MYISRLVKKVNHLFWVVSFRMSRQLSYQEYSKCQFLETCLWDRSVPLAPSRDCLWWYSGSHPGQGCREPCRSGCRLSLTLSFFRPALPNICWILSSFFVSHSCLWEIILFLWLPYHFSGIAEGRNEYVWSHHHINPEVLLLLSCACFSCFFSSISSLLRLFPPTPVERQLRFIVFLARPLPSPVDCQCGMIREVLRYGIRILEWIPTRFVVYFPLSWWVDFPVCLYIAKYIGFLWGLISYQHNLKDDLKAKSVSLCIHT